MRQRRLWTPVTAAFILVGIFGRAWALEDPKPAVPTLTVTGTGHLMIAPDMAYVTFGMQTSGKSLADAQRQNNNVMQKVITRLGELAIAAEHIQTSSFTVSPQYKPTPKHGGDVSPAPPEVIGYLVGNQITVELSKTDKVALVIEQALAAGANHFQGLQWALKEPQRAKLGAMSQAVITARDKARALSESLKLKLLRLISVSEGDAVIRSLSASPRSMMAMEAGGGEPPILGGQLKVEASVTLVYEIAQNDMIPEP